LERRGITVNNFQLNRGTAELTESRKQQKAQTGQRMEDEHRRDMSPAERVQLLQRKLYLKAKQEKEFRFYILYDKVFLGYVLKEAYRRVKQSGGSSGIDRQTFADIADYGEDKFLVELKEELRTRQYRPREVLRVWIPKSSGGKRPLGIPTIKDRVAQMACKLVIEPIFEADFADSSYGFRPKRSAHDAIKQIKANLQSGKTMVYDADLKSYFDSIPHEKLMKTLSLRITDRRILYLIKLWLKAPVNEDGKTTGGKKNKVGVPQGGVISPLLANIYLHLLDRVVNKQSSLFSQTGIKIVRYADDFVLMGQEISQKALEKLREVLQRMELEINYAKSKLIEVREEPLGFLGFTIRYDFSIYDRHKRFWHIKPSENSNKRLRQNINAKLKKIGHYPPEWVSREINLIMTGWLNYFDIKGVSYTRIARRKLNWYLRERLRRYYNRKSQRKSRLHGQQAFEKLVREYGLIDPYVALLAAPVNA
jgi:group II intron reverse transcriptase/maturase